jgi:hypothetical protein
MHSSFSIDLDIAIVSGELYCDLHNCFDFVSLNHRPTEKRTELIWHRGTGDWISKALPAKLTLSFQGVTNILVHRRDDDMPFTEDDCISEIAFLPPELADTFDSICAYRGDDEHISIGFQSGSGVKIWAESVTHETGEA